MKIKYIDQNCKSILHRIDNPGLPFNWCANPYRGCLHSCLYCYARYTHSYLDLDPERDFETTIFVKRNAAQILRKELSKPKWKKELVNLGSICDPYQPIENKAMITQAMLKEFARYKNPLTIATKSDLIIRDVGLLSEIATHTDVEVVISISTTNDVLQKEIEPRAPSTLRRLNAISKLRDNGLTVGVLLMPIVPFLGDSYSELDDLFMKISESGANYIIPGIMYLIGAAKKRFLEFIEIKHPDLKNDFKQYYQNRSPPKSYKEKMYQQFRELKKKHGLTLYHSSKKPERKNNQKTLDSWF